MSPIPSIYAHLVRVAAHSLPRARTHRVHTPSSSLGKRATPRTASPYTPLSIVITRVELAHRSRFLVLPLSRVTARAQVTRFAFISSTHSPPPLFFSVYKPPCSRRLLDYTSSLVRTPSLSRPVAARYASRRARGRGRGCGRQPPPRPPPAPPRHRQPRTTNQN